MVLLSGNATLDDKKPLYARDGWKIPTEKLPKQSLADFKNKVQHWNLYRPKAILRSISNPDYPYNCVGLVFASRRHWIESDYLPDLLHHDSYREIPKSEAVAGDIVLYRNLKSEYSHVALIVQVVSIGDTMNIKVLSKWGQDPEYEHYEDDLPEPLGKPVEYWTERVIP